MSTGSSAVDVRGESLRATAVSWFTEMNGSLVSAETRAAFDRWLAQAPEHHAAYDAVAGIHGAMRQASQHREAIELRHEVAIELTQRSTRWSRASLRVAVVAVVMACAVGLAVVMDVPGWLSGKGRYSTDIGERIQVTLPDQSQVTLNTDTRVKAVFSDRERRVILGEGQALFEVAKDSRRPFIVEAGGREFIAVGTAFDIRIRENEVQVTLVEGAIKVPASTDGLAGMLVRAGEQVSVGPSSPDPAPQMIGGGAVDRVTSWRRGRIIFEDTPLSEAIAEMNRYSAQKITLLDASVGGHRVNGAFAIGKPQAFVEGVMVYFPVEMARWDGREIALRARR